MTPLSINQCRDEYISGIRGSWPSNKLSTTVQTTSESLAKAEAYRSAKWSLKPKERPGDWRGEEGTAARQSAAGVGGLRGSGRGERKGTGISYRGEDV